NLTASFLGRLVKKIVYFGRAPMIDKIFGSLCGLLKASIVLILFYLAFELAATYLGNARLTWMDQSKAMTIASNVWNYLSGWLLKNGVINYLTLPNLIAKVHM
ncbi:MAG TPA: CvpA family protein, partial [Acetomicrobium sp.]|nr:CvpA family protein [Acetomicrobium sp.]